MRNTNDNVHYYFEICSTFRRFGKATRVKMTAEAAGKNSSSHFSVKT